MALEYVDPDPCGRDYQTMVRIIRNLLKQLGFEDVDDAAGWNLCPSEAQAEAYGL